MRISRVLWALALVLVFLVALVLSAPARLLSMVVPGEQIILQGVSGTLWQGSASRCMLRLPAGFIHLGAVQWSLEPLSLLTLSPRLQLSSEWGSQRIAGQLVLRGARDLDLRDLQGRISAGLLRHFAPVTVAGDFTLQIEQLELRDGLPQRGEGRLVWESAAWESPQGPVALGSYALDFLQPAGEDLVGKVLTLAGPLDASGSVILAERQYKLDILLSQAGLNAQLKQALELVATPVSEGYRLFLEGGF